MLKIGFVFIIIISPFLFIGGPNTHDLRIYFEFWQLGHFILFSLIILFLLHIQYIKSQHWVTRFIGTGIVCVVVGFGTEIMQYYFGRSFELKDVLNDVIGGYAGFFLAQSRLLSTSSQKSQFRLAKQIGLISLVCILAVFSGQSFIKAVINEINIRTYFPILSNFETFFEKDRWRTYRAKTSIGSQYARSGNNGMMITYLPAKYPSLGLRDFKGNWGDFNQLRLSIYNTQENSVDLILKIFDHQHHHTGYRYNDRFNKKITLTHGWNDLSFSLDEIKKSPESREMNMDEIYSFSLFMIQLKQSTTLYIDDVYLSGL